MAPTQRLSRWLRGEWMDDARYRDIWERVHSDGVFAGALGVAIALNAVVYGWWLLLLPVNAALILNLVRRLHQRLEVPQLAGLLSFTLLQINLAVGAFFSGGVGSPLFFLLVMPALLHTAFFQAKVTAACAAFAAAVSIAVAVTAPSGAPVAPLWLWCCTYAGFLVCAIKAARHLVALELRARDEAVVDPLTGLFNRKALQKHFGDLSSRAASTDGEVAMILIDVDHFKRVNDDHGHDTGDVVLKEVAQRLITAVRAGDLVYRLGGEEFMILLPDQNVAEAQAVAERLREQVMHEQISGLTITVSAGVGAARGERVEYDPMMRRVDEALYSAKHGGRNQVCVSA